MLGRVQPVIAEMLRSDDGKPKKQRHTARRIYTRLKEEYGYLGSEPSVRRCVAELRHRQPEVFVPLTYEPGTEAQVDFGEADVVIAGVRQEVQLFCMKLAYSRLPFVMAFPHQRQEAFFEGHREAFKFFGGVPRRLTYDNLKVAVQRILEGHNRQEQEAFRSLRAHYLFDSNFCNPERGNEKGQVESLVGYVRRNALVPVPEVRSREELNARLHQWCEGEKEHTVSGTEGTVGEHWAAEQPTLLHLPPQPFDCARVAFVKVNRYAQVTYETCAYSVPWRYAHQEAVLRAEVDRVTVWVGHECVAEHPRSYGRHQSVLTLDHYLEVFLTKPGALKYSIPFKQALLPEAYHELHRALRYSDVRRGDKEFVRVLMLHRQYPAEEVLWAVTEALERHIHHADGIQALLLMRHSAHDAPSSLDLQEYNHLPTVAVPPVRTEHFSRLLPKRGVFH